MGDTGTYIYYTNHIVRVALAVLTGLDGPVVEDERGYLLLAQSLAAGDGFALPMPSSELAFAAGLDAVPPLRAFRAPLLPLLGAPLAAAGGGVVALRVLSLLAGAVCAPLLLLGLRRCVAPRAAFLAKIGLAFLLSAVCVVPQLLSAVAATAGGRQPPWGEIIWFAGVGIVLGVLLIPTAAAAFRDVTARRER